ncbi:hypothetical protein ACVWYH_007204 [Bradyrhizobium sp. GM24.11]
MRYTPLLCLLLSSCSSIWVDASAPPPQLQPIQPPSQGAVRNGVSTFVKEAHLAQPVEISAPRKTDHGEGRYYVCLREANLSADKPHFIYAVFFDDEAYKGSRQSVILEDCEHQQYDRLDIVATETTKPRLGPTAQKKGPPA